MGSIKTGKESAISRDARKPNTACFPLQGRFEVKHRNSNHENLKNRRAKLIEELGQDF